MERTKDYLFLLMMPHISGHINIMNNYEQNSPSIQILTNVSESRPVVSLKIYDQGDQSGTNACDPSPCQHLCLPKPQMDYTCHCTLGYILENEIECKEDTKSDKVCSIQTQITLSLHVRRTYIYPVLSMTATKKINSKITPFIFKGALKSELDS